MLSFPATSGGVRDVVNKGAKRNEILLPNVPPGMPPIPCTITVNSFDVGRMAEEAHRHGPETRGQSRTFEQRTGSAEDMFVLTLGDRIRFKGNVGWRGHEGSLGHQLQPQFRHSRRNT